MKNKPIADLSSVDSWKVKCYDLGKEMIALRDRMAQIQNEIAELNKKIDSARVPKLVEKEKNNE